MSKEMISRDLSGCEQLIMRVLWESEEEVSTPGLIEALRTQFGKDYARTTVVTFVQRLAEKGFVTTYRKGRISYVKPAKKEVDYKDRFLNHASDFWFHGDASDLISALCGSKKISKREIKKMKDTVDGLDN